MSRLLAAGCWSRYFGARCCPYLHRWDSFLVNPSLRFRLFLAAGPFPRLDQGSLFSSVHLRPYIVYNNISLKLAHITMKYSFLPFQFFSLFVVKFPLPISSKLQIRLLPTSTFWMQTQCKALLSLDKTQNTAPPTTNNQLAHILLQDGTVSLVPDRSNGRQINGVIAGQGSRP